ncbi:MAG: PAS domain-containing protein, partial [Myxococcota bacterium]|nr:PAS domain-containing protein [Myxococcota bacterium]
MIEKRRKVEKPRNETLPHRENHDSPQPRARRQRRSASDLLSALAHLARDLGDTRHDEDSVASLAEACRRLFPGRLFDIHLVDPLTGEVRQVYANSRLSPLARGRLILTQGALGEVDPAVLARVKGHPLSIDVVPKYESVFEQSATGFDVAIHDHLALYGSVRVEYERPPTQAELASDRSAVTLLVRLMSNSLRASRLLEETLLLKDYLEKALEGAEAPMVVVDTTSRVTFVNNVFERLVSRSREELLGRPFLELIPNRDRTKLNALVASVLRGGPRRSVEVRYPSEEGRPAHHLSFTARPIAGAREEIEGVILVGQELTELRNLESQVIHSEKLAT